MNWEKWFIVLLRLILGGIFIYASLDKILHPSALADIIYNYQVLPERLINITAIVLPWLELILGGMLLTGKLLPGAALLCGLLLAGFWTALLFNLARGLDITCGCFSTQGAEQTSAVWYVFRDTAFLVMSLVLLKLISRPGREIIPSEG